MTPAEIVERAFKLGLRVIALTDHDTTDGVDPAQKAAHGLGLDVIPDVEISTKHPSGECHILGYFIDLDNAELQPRLSQIRQSRQSRALCIAARLERLGLPITWE